MLRYFVITLLCLILTSARGESGSEIWRTPLRGYDLLYDPVEDIFYAGSATFFQDDPAASIHRLNGATGKLIGDPIAIGACGDGTNVCSFVGKFAGYYNFDGSLKYIILTAISAGANNAFALYETATNSILWTYNITQEEAANVDPPSHAEPGASFSPDGSHVFVLIPTNDGIVNYAFKIDGEYLFKIIDHSGITASPDSKSIYTANRCGVDQIHIDTMEKISSWEEPECNLDIHDRPTVDSEGNVYVLNNPTTVMSLGLIKLGSNLTEGPLWMTTTPPPFDTSSFWFSPVLNKDESIVAVTIDGGVSYRPLIGLDPSDGTSLWNTTNLFFPAIHSTVYSESKQAFYTTAGEIEVGGYVSGYDETTGSSIVTPSGLKLVYDFAIVSDERMGVILLDGTEGGNAVILYNTPSIPTTTNTPTAAPSSGAFKFEVMEGIGMATIGALMVSCFY
uniref:SMP-30/Gluconolactonase/LRE-like region domain-containing protein n=1 Tax=Attheya septentrionalis TaxID=420275 RepID=A0A7S2XSW1_9STRA|mmetsp:Transcript_5663/g.9983  ORF Transcript_5663/g.9983 Transcript_5663/m.9983 type:complete len:450 (+) Transcript_5663:174-1523(+)